MQDDQRLTPLPKTTDLKEVNGEYQMGYPAFYDEDAVEGRRSIRQYFDIVYKRLPLILALTILATAMAAFYMYRLPNQYSATTQMVIEPRKQKSASKDSININFGNDANYYNTQLQLLQSADLMREVVIATGLYQDPNLFKEEERGIGSAFRSIFSSQKSESATVTSLPVISETASSDENSETPPLTPEQESRASNYAALLGGTLQVQQQQGTNIVRVTVTNKNPTLAAKVADGVARVFIKQDEERELMGARQVKEDLENSIEKLRETIAEKESQLIVEMRDSNLPLQEKGQDLLASRLQSMSESWQKALEGRRQLEARYNAAVQANSRGEGMNIPDLYENKIFQDTMRLNTERKAKLQDTIRKIEEQIQDAESERAELLVRYTPEYSKVKEKEEKIASLKTNKEKTEREVSQIIERDQNKIEKDAVGGALVALKSQLDSARKQEAQSLASYDREAATANIQGQAQMRLTTLKQEIDTSRSLLDSYTQQLKERELAIASGRPDNIKIATSAVESSSPIGPQRGRNILVAFFISLGAGIGLAFLMDYLDDSVKSSDDIGRQLGLPTLALIPHHNIADRRKLSLMPKNGNGLASATAMITLEDRHSPMAEAYRHLRTSLLFSSAGKPPQTILVTSSQPSEGKTTTAINTAITLAQSDADVVIIDCDLRRPRLHTYFEMENTQGLTNYLSGERNTENLIKNCKGLPKLKVITSGPIPPNPAELLSSDEMKNLLKFLRGKYKHVIIDSPPAISFTDAAILSTLVDGVVLVAMAGKSSMHLMRRFKQRLGNIGARIYGVVLNGVKSNSVEYDYYGSGYYDYYGKSSADDATPYIEEAATIHDTKG
ncbi:MAG: polysaccharide biosynthesis tyrosine autokinase [Saprospiraceae bacterium]|nr:polysaccharide biosynthesis tyrosine autokinase [Pyrinomonadaceae bacterium]